MATTTEIKKAFETMKAEMKTEIDTTFGKFVCGIGQIEKGTATRWLFSSGAHSRDEALVVMHDMESTKAFQKFSETVGGCKLTLEVQRDGFYTVRFHY